MYNLTTIEPDDETLATLIDAVDSAVTSLQNAISGPGTGDIRIYSIDIDIGHCIMSIWLYAVTSCVSYILQYND